MGVSGRQTGVWQIVQWVEQWQPHTAHSRLEVLQTLELPVLVGELEWVGWSGSEMGMSEMGSGLGIFHFQIRFAGENSFIVSENKLFRW